ncbi:hypothetical protein Tco_0404977 [Tanacetum coccineum]
MLRWMFNLTYGSVVEKAATAGYADAALCTEITAWTTLSLKHGLLTLVAHKQSGDMTNKILMHIEISTRFFYEKCSRSSLYFPPSQYVKSSK